MTLNAYGRPVFGATTPTPGNFSVCVLTSACPPLLEVLTLIAPFSYFFSCCICRFFLPLSSALYNLFPHSGGWDYGVVQDDDFFPVSGFGEDNNVRYAKQSRAGGYAPFAKSLVQACTAVITTTSFT